MAPDQGTLRIARESMMRSSPLPKDRTVVAYDSQYATRSERSFCNSVESEEAGEGFESEVTMSGVKAHNFRAVDAMARSYTPRMTNGSTFFFSNAIQAPQSIF